MQSLNTIPDGHVTDKLANDRISAKGWPKLGGYRVVTGRPDACNTKYGLPQTIMVKKSINHDFRLATLGRGQLEQLLEAVTDGRLKVGTFVVEVQRSSYMSQQQRVYRRQMVQ